MQIDKGQMLNTTMHPDTLTAVRQMLIDRFDLDELRDLCFALGVDYAIFPQWCAGMARELIVHIVRHNQMPSLLEKIGQLRPDINIPSYLAPKQKVEPPNTAGDPKVVNPNAITLAWSKVLGSPPCATPIVLGQVLMVPITAVNARGSVLRALTLSRGNTLWELCFEDVIISGFTPAGDDVVLVSLSQIDAYDGEGMLLALDTRGREIWRYTPGVRLVSAAAVVDMDAMDLEKVIPTAAAAGKDHALARIEALVAVTTDHQWLEIIDLKTGQQLIEVNLSSEAALSAPAFGPDLIYVPCLAPTFLAVSLDGEVNWRFDAPALSDDRIDQTPCVVGNLVIVTMRHGTVVAFHARDGSMMWETTVGRSGSVLTAPVTDGMRVYIGAGHGTHALQLANGREVWHTPSPAPVHVMPEVWNDIVVVISEDRVIQALDRFSGEIRWQESFDHGSNYAPIVVDGDDNGPYAMIVDCQGYAIALTIPADPEMHENAGRWKRAALGWEYVGRMRRAAMAWVRYAKASFEQGNSLSICAPAWQAAERLFAVIGDEDRAAGCRRENARCLRLPLISLDVEHKGLVANAWSLLNFSVSNEGFGLARHLVIQTQARQFEGQISMTQALAHLPPGRSRNRRLDVKPLESGSAVPLTVEVSYVDEMETFHSREETIHLSVGQSENNRTPAAMHILTQPGLSGSERLLQRAAVELELRISWGSEAYAIEVSLDDGHDFSGGKLSKSILTWQPSGNPVEDGRFLFNQLVSDATVRDAWRIAQGEAISQSLPRRIRLRIGSDVPELHSLPWELLHDGVVMLSANSNTPFSRYLPVPQPWGQPLITRPIRVLGVISNPKDLHDRYQLGRLDVDLEKYILATAFKGIEQGRIRLEFMPAPVTPENLSHVLRSGYQIVHFVGHGRFVGHSKSAELFMEDQKGYSLPVADQTLARIFSHADIRPHLVFLSVCQSASHSSRDAFVGMAPKLVLAGVPTVIGMQDRVRTETARKVTQIFYRRLTDHGYVDQALNEARAALMVSDPYAVQTPVLFMRLQSGRLWDLGL